MTLIALGVLLTFIVFAGVFMSWDIRTTFLKANRSIRLADERFWRESEDRAWADFLAEADARRFALERALQADGAVNRLRDLINDYSPAPLSALRRVA